MGKRALSATAPMADALAMVQSGEWDMNDLAAWDESRSRTIIITADNMTADQFITLTKLDHPGDEDKRDLMLGKDKIVAKPKRFKTGSVGYNLNGKINLVVGGKPA